MAKKVRPRKAAFFYCGDVQTNEPDRPLCYN